MIKSKPNDATSFESRAKALLNGDMRDPVAWESKARQFLRDYPRHSIAHYVLAQALTSAKKMREAFPYAEAAHKLDGKNPHFAFLLGFLYLKQHLHEFALPLLRAAAKADPSSSKFQEALGECYQEIGQGEQAIGFLTRALERTSDNERRVRIMAKLANVQITSNRLDEGRHLLHAMLAMEGIAKTSAIQELARISKDGAKSPEAAMVRDVLAMPDIKDDLRLDLKLSLGQFLDRDGDYDGAFALWQEARSIAKENNWKLNDQKSLFNEITEFYSKDLLAALTPYGHSSDAPVFVVGMPRSGTTLTEQIVASHPASAGVGELGRFNALNRAFQLDYPIKQRIQQLKANAAKGELRQRAAEILRIFEVVADAPFARVVEKTPHNFRNVGYLRLMFPKARFIHCRRHPLDSFLSSYQNNLTKDHGYAFDQLEYLKEFLFQEEIMNHWKSLFPEQIMTLHYEEMATDPETWARKLIAFIGLPWDEACLRFHEKGNTVRTISTQQVRKPVNTASVGRWRNYERHLGPIMAALAESGFVYPDVTTHN